MKRPFRQACALGSVFLLGFGVLYNQTAPLAAETEPRPIFKEFARPDEVPHPKNNPYSKAKAELGRRLFFDPLLSTSQIVSCGTCHNPGLAWGDGLVRSVGEGMRPLSRRSPTILNLAWASTLFWDGRAETLEEQALEALRLPRVMNMPPEVLVQRIKNNGSYLPYFNEAFPNAGITSQTIAMAIGTFERTVVSGLSPFDRWNQGDQQAVSDSAKRGFQTFMNKGGCAECHGGWRFTDDSFHDIGLPDSDLGRGKILPQVEVMQHAFKTPTLRNVALRAPYMHDGSRATLANVVEHYNKGGEANRPSLSDAIKPLRLSSVERQDLVNFLQALTSEY